MIQISNQNYKIVLYEIYKKLNGKIWRLDSVEIFVCLWGVWILLVSDQVYGI